MSRPQFDPTTYDAQLADKTERLRALLAPFDAPEPTVFDSPREHYRLRTEFRLWRETGITVIFVTHSVFESAFLSNRIVVMRARPGQV